MSHSHPLVFMGTDPSTSHGYHTQKMHGWPWFNRIVTSRLCIIPHTGYINSKWIPTAVQMLANSDLVVLFSELWQEVKSVHVHHRCSSFQIFLVCIWLNLWLWDLWILKEYWAKSPWNIFKQASYFVLSSLNTKCCRDRNWVTLI